MTAEARLARIEDAAEIVRLARLMFESMGASGSDGLWERATLQHVQDRLGADLAIFVVDDPIHEGRLVASAAGTINRRLPGPFVPHGVVGYVQWVCTDLDHRRQGLSRQVMAALLAWYEERQVPVVELHATPMGEPLYRSMGFDDPKPRALRRRTQ